jgi:hypothetical protein
MKASGTKEQRLFERPSDARTANCHSALRLDALRPKEMAPNAPIQMCEHVAPSVIESVEQSSRVADGLRRWLVFASISSVNVASSLFSKRVRARSDCIGGFSGN